MTIISPRAASGYLGGAEGLPPIRSSWIISPFKSKHHGIGDNSGPSDSEQGAYGKGKDEV